MDDINSWKKHKDDPPPAEYDYYPKTNYKSLAFSEVSNDYEYYEKYSVFITLIIVSNIFFIFVKERPVFKLLSMFSYNFRFPVSGKYCAWDKRKFLSMLVSL